MNKEEQEEIIVVMEKMIKHNIGICFREEDITYYFRSDEMMNILNYINELENKLASKEKQIKLMQQCDLAKELNKLQKENELLKAPFEYANGNTLDKKYVELNFVSKDKIRELAQEYKPNQSNTFIESQERYIELVKKLEILGE